MSGARSDQELTPLIVEERRFVLGLARQSVLAMLGGGPAPTVGHGEGPLYQRCGAFVTLYHFATLRGCVGTLDPEGGFAIVVMRLARAAARDDHRFAPIRLEEMSDVRIEISRLSPLRSAHADEIEIGVHGVCVEHGAARAVLLPKVATEHGWGREQLLAALCQKAGLPESAWKDAATRIAVFRAEVFGESDLNP